jgi:hypothetical protein
MSVVTILSFFVIAFLHFLLIDDLLLLVMS